MAFKFVAAFCLIVVVAAGDYEYNKPNDNKPTSNNYETNVNNDTNKNVVAQKSAQQDSSNSNNNNVQDSYNAEPQNNNSYQQQQQDNNNDNTAYDDETSATYQSSGDNAYNVPSSNTYQSPPVVNNQQYGYNYNPVEYYPPAKYEYSYSVNDPTTGDIKSHSETRDGYYVRGAYSLVDPDGYKRTVTYTADQVNGFNAIVNREPIATHFPVPAAKYQASSVEPQTNHQNLNTPAAAQDSYASTQVQDGKGPYA